MSSPAFITGMPVSVAHKSSFAPAAISSRRPQHAVSAPAKHPQRAQWQMAKVAKFGPFTPAVIATKVVIGDKNLNKIRGKGIALHSQVITVFCEFTGAGPKTRQTLIRTAKNNGNTLGFLS